MAFNLNLFNKFKENPNTKVNNPFSKAKTGVTRSVHRMTSGTITGNILTKGLGLGRQTATTHGGVIGATRGYGKLLGKNIKRGATYASTSKIGRTVKKASNFSGKAMGKVFNPKVRGILGVGGLLTAGAAMVGVGLMRGAINGAQDIVAERYMQDQRFARNIVMNTRVGRAASNARSNRYGHLDGLSQALSAGRHGRY